MRCIAILLVLWCCAAGAEPVPFSGTIGPYAVEMELERGTEDTVTGRYRYAGKEAWLTLSGEAFGRDAVQLTERVDGEATGRFFLEARETGLVGFWAAGDTDFEVALRAQTDVAVLFPEEPEPEVSEARTGQYAAGGYWVNAWFAPDYEIGFNGGAANVVTVSENTILVQFEFVVGPTYHFASFSGLAQRTRPGVFEHNAVLEGSDAPCHLVFVFSERALEISHDTPGWECQFGMRAHANFTLPKTSDVAEFSGHR